MKTESKNFVLYDVETSGTSAHYDQIFEVGAVLTDEHLNVLDRLELRCRRLPSVISNPDAMLATGADAALCSGGDHSHYALVRAVHQKFTDWSPATYCAHNGIQFDENMLRQAFFQTLHRPYLTQSGGNRRIDSMAMAQACSILTPGRLTIPDLDGKPTYRLGHLARANGVKFPEASAHDALHDVEAMRGLMAVMADRAPDVYAAVLRNSDKKSRLGESGQNDKWLFCLTASMIGAHQERL
jgi:exodeoxyribonuclease-1